MTIRELTRKEVEKLWDINRSELAENIFYWRDGRLLLEQEYYYERVVSWRMRALHPHLA